ncbi:MFS transporter [Microbacterium terrisoli]|uniref:MFS transporter n=1 Tax=Microbacterium terrisoli TaxID=3242192 RepID=UPI002805BAB2|nr:MFS transporter [Microbacterium protaetiae]
MSAQITTLLSLARPRAEKIREITEVSAVPDTHPVAMAVSSREDPSRDAGLGPHEQMDAQKKSIQQKSTQKLTARLIGDAPYSAVLRRGRIPERTVLVVASIGAVLAFLDATIVNIAFPSIAASFPGESVGTVSWVLNAFNVVFASFMIVFGRLGDVMGRRTLYLVGIVLFTVASVVCALAPSIGVLIGARVVQALGAAMIVPASLALVIEGFSGGGRARAVGLWSAAAAVAAGMGPPLGGLVVQAGGWTWAFWVNVPLGAAAWWLGRHHLVNSRAPGRRRMPDMRGAVLLAAALGLTTLAIIKGSDWGADSLLLWGVVGAAVVLFIGFVLSSMKHPVPVLDLVMMRNRPFLVANVATLIAGVGFFAYMLTNVLWLQYVWHYTVLQAGIALIPGALVAAVVAGLLEPVAARYGYRWIIASGFVVWALGYLWYVQVVGTTPAFLAQWLPGQIISGIGVGATLPLLAASTLASQPGGRYATASAVISSARQVGGTVGVAILVVMLGTPTALTVVPSLRDGWIMCIVSFVVGGVITLFMGRIGQDDQHAPAVASSDPSPLRQPASTKSVVLRRSVPPVEESLFGRLPEAARERIAAGAVERCVPAGEWLLRAGDSADSMFVVLTGRAEVVIEGQVVRELGPGSVVGELALFTGGTRSASIRARRDCRVMEVSRALVDQAIGEDAAALTTLVAALARQLAGATPVSARVAVRPCLVAVIGTTPGVPVEAVADMLCRGIAEHLRVTMLVGSHSPEQVDRAETENQMVVLVGAGPDEEWVARCAREADTVVLVGTVGEPPTSTMPPMANRPELVLVTDVPSRTARQAWLAAVDPWRVSELTSREAVAGHGLPNGLRGLVDRLSGRSIGLVFGGGGARAITQVGVLLELEESGIRIDRLAGASMGAIISGCYATGGTADEVSEIAYQEFVREDPLSDYHLPRTSLARGRRVQQGLQRGLGDWQIEELPRGFRCVSTDLLHRERVMHRTGSMVDAISASSRLPILFAPIPSEGRLLVDGGVLDNLPVDALTERDEGPIIAVNISMGGGAHPRKPGAAPRPVRVPPLGETMLRTLMIGGGGAAEAQRQGAWVITPHSMGVGLLEFHQFDRMVESGRAAVRALLEQTGGDLFTVGE